MNTKASASEPSRSVLVVCGEFPPRTGGIGTYAHEIARHLAADGWRVGVAAVQDCPEAERRAFNAAASFKVETLPWKGASRAVGALVRSGEFDVIVAADVHGLMWSWLPSRLARRPLVALGHGSEFVRGRGVSSLVKRLLYRTCTHVVFNSRFTMAQAQARGFRARASSIIHPAGGDAVAIQPGAAARLREKFNLSGKRVLLTVGTVSRRKGQTAVIEAMPEVLRQVPEACYLVVGREADSGEAARLVARLGLGEGVILAGALGDAERAAAYDLAEFSILPSRNLPDEVEGFGIVVLEAGACGRTTIGTAETGVAEAIQDGVTGLLVPPDSPSAMAAAIVRLLQDQPLLTRLSGAARAHAATQTWAGRAREWSVLLEGLRWRR